MKISDSTRSQSAATSPAAAQLQGDQAPQPQPSSKATRPPSHRHPRQGRRWQDRNRQGHCCRNVPWPHGRRWPEVRLSLLAEKCKSRAVPLVGVADVHAVGCLHVGQLCSTTHAADYPAYGFTCEQQGTTYILRKR